MAPTPSGHGYWLAASDGGIFSFGDAHFYGSTGNLRLARPVVGMAPTRTGHGYWLVASDGGIFSFGDAHFYGSTGNLRLARPVVGMAPTPSGHGYWLAASDGGIFSFGDAHFYGSTGNLRLARPVVGMIRTPSGHGYWMAASDGGIFSFGDAHFYGSTGNLRLVQPIVGVARSLSGHGYWLVAADGGIFSFGDAHFSGSAAGSFAGQRAVAMASSPDGNGYWIVGQWGAVDSAASGRITVDPNITGGSGGRAIANDLINRINRERAARGLPMLFVDPLVQAYANAWAAHLSATNTFAHQNLLALLHAASGRLEQAGENLFRASGAPAMNAGTAHLALDALRRAPCQHPAARGALHRRQRGVRARLPGRCGGFRHADWHRAARTRRPARESHRRRRGYGRRVLRRAS